jgi:hypothetical protein
MLAGTAQADLITNVDLQLRNNESFTLFMDNDSEGITSWTVELEGVGNSGWDIVNNAVPHTPDVGSNNDGNAVDTMTWNPANPNFGELEISGDIDGGVSGVRITLNYANGETRILDATRSGQNIPFLWSAAINEPDSGPPPVGPIVDGQGEAMLSWVAPTENEDGTTIQPGELSGFGIYWSTLSRNGRCGSYPTTLLDGQCYDNALDINDPTAVSADVTLDLDEDTTVYFAATAYKIVPDPANPGETRTLISKWSNEIAKRFEVEVTLPPEPEPPLPPTTFDVTVTLTCTTDTEGATCEVKEVTP